MGKLPRKRKIERFEVNMQDDGSPYSAIKALQKLVKEHKIRDAHGACIQLWHGHETEFTDSNGQKQVMVFRNLFPSGAAIALDINEVLKD